MDKPVRIQFENSASTRQTCPEINRGKEIRYINRSQIESLGYTPTDILKLVRTALTEHGKGMVEMPAKIGIHPIYDAFHHAMPAFVPAAGASGIKWVGCFPENPRYKLDQTSAIIILNDIQTGWPLAIMDGTWITAKRTAAVSAIAAEHLAAETASEMGILGCGVQGHEHLTALAAVTPGLKKVKIMDIRPGIARQMIDRFQAGYPFEIAEAASAEELARGSDIIVSATAILQTPRPVIKDEWIKTGALLLPVDLDSVFEWQTMKRADKFLVDSLEEMDYFMSIGYLAHGLPPLHAEIGEVVAGIKPGRQSNEETIFDMNIGMGLVDVVVARDILDRAIKENIGKRLSL